MSRLKELLWGTPEEITDRSKQKAVGRRLLLNNLSEKSSAYWKVADGFSMLTLGPVLRDLVASAKTFNEPYFSAVISLENQIEQAEKGDKQ